MMSVESPVTIAKQISLPINTRWDQLWRKDEVDSGCRQPHVGNRLDRQSEYGVAHFPKICPNQRETENYQRFGLEIKAVKVVQYDGRTEFEL